MATHELNDNTVVAPSDANHERQETGKRKPASVPKAVFKPRPAATATTPGDRETMVPRGTSPQATAPAADNEAAPAFEGNDGEGAPASGYNEATTTQPEPTHTLTLNSHEAQALWRGRQSPDVRKRIVGCLEFSRYVRDICRVARELDDPYAFHQLILIERALTTMDAHISGALAELKSLLAEDEDSGLTYNAPFMKSFAPEVYPVLFASGYGYAAARLLGKYDKLIVLSVTARNCALMGDAEWHKTVPETSKRMRAFYELGRRFRHSGAARDDFAANNARARAAIEKYGPLPDAILQGDVLPQLLPKSWRARTRAEKA